MAVDLGRFYVFVYVVYKLIKVGIGRCINLKIRDVFSVKFSKLEYSIAVASDNSIHGVADYAKCLKLVDNIVRLFGIRHCLVEAVNEK